MTTTTDKIAERRTHELKTDPGVFQAVLDGTKTFEIRFNDRNFQIGDVLLLRETKLSGETMRHGAPLEYTGRQITKLIGYILRGPAYGISEGWIIASFAAHSPFASGADGQREPTIPMAQPERRTPASSTDDLKGGEA